jgi:hypothetical protein
MTNEISTRVVEGFQYISTAARLSDGSENLTHGRNGIGSRVDVRMSMAVPMMHVLVLSDVDVFDVLVFVMTSFGTRYKPVMVTVHSLFFVLRSFFTCKQHDRNLYFLENVPEVVPSVTPWCMRVSVVSVPAIIVDISATASGSEASLLAMTSSTQ